MAGVSDGRGQILLVGAITIAVTFVSLGIVLNGSLHTPAIAAEASDDATGTGLEEVRDSLGQEATGLLHTANDEFASFSDQRGYVVTNLTALGDGLRSYYARKDAAFTLEPGTSSIQVIEGTYGSVLVSDSDASMYAQSGVELRNLNVDVSGLSGDATIWIRNGGGTDYRLQFDSNSITVNGGSACHFGSVDTIEVTNASAGNVPCSNLEFVNGLDGSYRIEVHQPTNGQVGVEFVADASSLSADARLTSGPRIYGLEVPFAYRSPTVTFVGTVTIKPGEP